MGLAIQTVRPRNYGHLDEAKFDSLSISDNGEFTMIGQTAVASSAINRSMSFPYAVVIKRMWVVSSTNSLDASSVNTFTLVVDGSDTTMIITITDSSAVGAPLEDQRDILVPAGDSITVRWNSDSTGAWLYRTLGLTITAVGLSN